VHSDNYAYIVVDDETNLGAIVDPGLFEDDLQYLPAMQGKQRKY
jgi:hypothetical protein